jgi:murein DD-endopeptidase MepM/ murein hydrolase activator NlpD
LASYTIARGDTLSAIAARFGTTVSALAAANGIANPNNIYAGHTLTIPGGGGGGAPAPAPAPPATNTVDTAIDAYGPMAQIVNAVPDLKAILNSAVSQQWSAAKFTAAVQASPWYQQHSDTARNLLMTQAADPAAYQQEITNKADQISILAGQLGHTVDTTALATQALLYGWDDNQLQTQIAHGGLSGAGNGALVGSAAQLSTQLEQTMTSYGVPYTQDYVNAAVNSIQQGYNTLDGYVQIARQQAKTQYPQYATQLDQGQTMVQIADPYMAQMAKTLELNQNQVTLNDPYIQKALSVRDPQSGAVTSQSMWQFTQNLKQDPRYDHTDQAKTDAYTTLAQIGKDFGFNGTSGGTAGGSAA